MPTLNLGILAHVDAGKTTLTERLLFDAGVIDTLGSVDTGSTHTDFLPLERQRGITIKSAVVSFALGDTTVNLIDTPGHPDFIAEVERALSVLDGVVLVISAVEGVQPQTRILMRALQRRQVPTLLFVNKIDRRGARDDDLLDEIARRLGVDVTPATTVDELGTRGARTRPLTVEDSSAQPVFFGSALTGAGVAALTHAITQLLPPSAGVHEQPLSARVFKIERGRAGEKVAYARVFDGGLRVRQRVAVTGGRQNKVTAIEVFHDGKTVRRDAATPGEIAKVWGLSDVRVGDVIGDTSPTGVEVHFGPPTLEAVIRPVEGADGSKLRVALGQLAEQDPLINVRYDDEHHERSVSLYGEVQKEVIEATLASDFAIAVAFGETRTVYVERPVGTGEACELLVEDDNPTSATMGLRVEPAPPGTGVVFTLDVDGRTLPTYIYKSSEAFVDAMTLYLREAFREGLRGWEVTDCRVTMTRSGYYIGDGPTKPTRPTPRTTAKDFRKLTPLVVTAALARAGTVVCGPVMRVHIECPTSTAGAVAATLTRLGGTTDGPRTAVDSTTIAGTIGSERVQDLRRELTRLTSGEGVVEAVFAGYQPVRGKPPTRPRTTPNPLNRKSYFLATMRHRHVRGGEYT